MTAEQLALDLFPATGRTDPATCPHVRATVDVGGGKAKCGAWKKRRDVDELPRVGLLHAVRDPARRDERANPRRLASRTNN